MSDISLGPILVVSLAVISAVTALGSLAITLEALRAKLRARAFLYRASLKDQKLKQTLGALDDAEHLSLDEIHTRIAELEARLSVLSERDRRFIGQGLHQNSINGVKRFAKELATAF